MWPWSILIRPDNGAHFMLFNGSHSDQSENQWALPMDQIFIKNDHSQNVVKSQWNVAGFKRPLTGQKWWEITFSFYVLCPAEHSFNNEYYW